MKQNQLFEKYKDQPVFQAAIAVSVITVIIKVAIWGFEFGHWLKVH